MLMTLFWWHSSEGLNNIEMGRNGLNFEETDFEVKR